MGIPGYSAEYGYTYDETAYDENLTPLVGIIGSTYTEVMQKMKDVRAEILSHGGDYYNIVTSEGNVDLGKIKGPASDELLAKGITVFVDWGEGGNATEITSVSGTPPEVFSAYVNGSLTLFFGDAARATLAQWTTPVQASLITPRLYISSVDTPYTTIAGETAGGGVTHQFVATFLTKWGETGPSNAVSWTDYTSDETDFAGGPARWTVTLEVEAEAVPSYAQSVKYYRFFGTSARLVGEVKI